MARINIEDCWWADPRRSLLASKIKNEVMVDGIVVRAWRLAQEFWKNDKGLVPLDLFETLPHFQELIDSKLADVRGSFVYVRGSSVYLDWVREKREAGRSGGLKSAEARRAKNGSAQPENQNRQSKPEADSKQNEASAKQTQPSGSYSYSGSISVSGSLNSSSTENEIQDPLGYLDQKNHDYIELLKKFKLHRRFGNNLDQIREIFASPNEFQDQLANWINAKVLEGKPVEGLETRNYVSAALASSLGLR